jgi:hypothetical protein
MRPASRNVSWSPSITEIRTEDPRRAMVRSSSVVFPAPGEAMTLMAAISRPSNHPRLRAASRSFLASTSCSSFITRARACTCGTPSCS